MGNYFLDIQKVTEMIIVKIPNKADLYFRIASWLGGGTRYFCGDESWNKSANIKKLVDFCGRNYAHSYLITDNQGFGSRWIYPDPDPIFKKIWTRIRSSFKNNIRNRAFNDWEIYYFTFRRVLSSMARFTLILVY